MDNASCSSHLNSSSSTSTSSSALLSGRQEVAGMKQQANVAANNSNNNKRPSENQRGNQGAVGGANAAPSSLSELTKAPPKTSKMMSANRPKSSKKTTHVRFDDYMDLNEENMRRSCKLLMNRLYSVPDKTANGTGQQQRQQQQSGRQANVGPRRATSPPPPISDSPDADYELREQSNDDDGDDNASCCVEPKLRQTTTNSPIDGCPPKSSFATPATSGKSYLRAQYERRQKRQLELMSGEKQRERLQSMDNASKAANGNYNGKGGGRAEHATSASNQNGSTRPMTSNKAAPTNGGSAGNSDVNMVNRQQDLVAKSHELSKRRFFEKLQHRESLKNLNLNTVSTPMSRPAPVMQIIMHSDAAPDEHKTVVDFREKFMPLQAGVEPKNLEEKIFSVAAAQSPKQQRLSNEQVKRSSLSNNQACKTSLAANNGYTAALETASHEPSAVLADATAAERAVSHSERLFVVAEQTQRCHQPSAKPTPLSSAETASHSVASTIGLPAEDLSSWANELIGSSVDQRAAQRLASPVRFRQQQRQGLTAAACVAGKQQSRAVAGLSHSRDQKRQQPPVAGCNQFVQMAQLSPHHVESGAARSYRPAQGGDEQTSRQGMACNGHQTYEVRQQQQQIIIDESEFEIKVPASSSSQTDANKSGHAPADEFGASLLVVKQLDEICSRSGPSPGEPAEVASVRRPSDGAGGPHTLIGRRIDEHKSEPLATRSTRVDKFSIQVRESDGNKRPPHSSVDYCTGASRDESPEMVIGMRAQHKEAAALMHEQATADDGHHHDRPSTDNERNLAESSGPVTKSSATISQSSRSAHKQEQYLKGEQPAATTVADVSHKLGAAAVADELGYRSGGGEAIAADADATNGKEHGSDSEQSKPAGETKRCNHDGGPETVPAAAAGEAPLFGVGAVAGTGALGQDQIDNLVNDAFTATCKQATCSAPIGQLVGQLETAQKQQQQVPVCANSASGGSSEILLAAAIAIVRAPTSSDADEVAAARSCERAKTMITTELPAIRDVLPEAQDRKQQQMAKVAEAADVSFSGAGGDAADAAADEAVVPPSPPLYDAETVTIGQRKVDYGQTTSAVGQSACAGPTVQQQGQVNEAVRRHEEIEKEAPLSDRNKGQPAMVHRLRPHEEINTDEQQQQQQGHESQSQLASSSSSSVSNGRMQVVAHKTAALSWRTDWPTASAEHDASYAEAKYANPFGGKFSKQDAANGNSVNHGHEQLVRAAHDEKVPSSPSASSSCASSGMISACGNDDPTKDARPAAPFECSAARLRSIEPFGGALDGGKVRATVNPNRLGATDQSSEAATSAVTNHTLLDKIRCATTCTSSSTSGLDEDVGSSSCGSSSGFGASVSVTSASSSASSSHSSRSPTSDSLKETHADYQCPVSFAPLSPDQLVTGSANNDDDGAGAQQQQQHRSFYDTIRRQLSRSRTPAKQIQDQFPDYKQLVGPDQEYPAKSKRERPLVIENYGYASLVNHCQVPAPQDATSLALNDNAGASKNFFSLQQSEKNFQLHGSHIFDHCAGQRMYENLPAAANGQRQPKQQQPPVEYATVRARGAALASTTTTTAALSPVENKSHSAANRPNSLSSAASLSGQSCSGQSSAESGGFSRMPPARIIDCPPTNNLQKMPVMTLNESGAMTMSDHAGIVGQLDQPNLQANGRKSSLFKRFGSLVSKAFASSGGAASATTANQAPTEQEQQTIERRALKSTAGSPAIGSPERGLRKALCAAGRAETMMATHQHRAAIEMDSSSVYAQIGISPSGQMDCGSQGLRTLHKFDETAQVPAEQQSRAVIDAQLLMRKQEMNVRGVADLIILPSKHHRTAAKDKTREMPRTSEELVPRSLRRSARHRDKSRHHRRRLSRSSSSIYSSLECLSLTANSEDRARQVEAAGRQRDSSRAFRPLSRKPERERASSLSEELESMISQSDSSASVASGVDMKPRRRRTSTDERDADLYVADSRRSATSTARIKQAEKRTLATDSVAKTTTAKRKYGEGGKKSSAKARIDIDCVSPVAITAARQAAASQAQLNAADDGGDLQSLKAASAKSKLLSKWFGGSTGGSSFNSSANRQQNESNETAESNGGSRTRTKSSSSSNFMAIKRDPRESLYDTNEQASENSSLQAQQQHQPVSRLWGFSSLIEHGHANYADKSERPAKASGHAFKQQQQQPQKLQTSSAALRTKRDADAKKQQQPRDLCPENDKCEPGAGLRESNSLIYSRIKITGGAAGKKESRLELTKFADTTERATCCSNNDLCNLSGTGSASSCSSGSGSGSGSSDDEQLHGGSKSFQSLNLYQNMLRSYLQRRRRRHNHDRFHRHHSQRHRHTGSRHHHHSHHDQNHNEHDKSHQHREEGHKDYRHYNTRGHHHHNHSQHYQCKHHTSGHAHCLASPTTRCGQQNCSTSLSQPCLNGSAPSRHGGKSAQTKTKLDRAGTSVWGQLIKISKGDGSQVIELHRQPDVSWGFFVARGALNNVKGIFISRMHDTATSSSLSGLLSIGDRILSIDESTIGPDYDILRVNQLISNKTKISLRVKPFKG